MDADKINEEVEGDSRLLEEERANHLLPDSTKTGKQNGDNGDSAGEKLLSEVAKINSNKEVSEVKFLSADSQNGDAKIDIENMKIAFAGMGKEELMKFANDPFWIKMRWFLFVFFWLLWAGMLLGAVAIIVMAPKCAAPAPLKWWEQSGLYDVYVRSYKDGAGEDGVGDIKGLTSKLDYIESLGVKGVIISPVFKSSNPSTDDTVQDFKDIDPLFGTLQDFKDLTSAMKNKGLHLIMNLVPNHSSDEHPWFKRSQERDDQYVNYYVWADGKNGGLPNNWKSMSGGSAWEYSKTRKQYYLHQFSKDQPDLNFHNKAVIDEFKDIIKFWLENGASGFELDKIQYLLEDEKLRDEQPGSEMGPTHNQYEFYSHMHTYNLAGVTSILSEWRRVLKNHTDSSGMLSVKIHSPMDVRLDSENETYADVLRYADLFSNLPKDFTADNLTYTIDKWRTKLINTTYRPYWELTNLNTSRVASRFSPDIVDGLNMVTMLLPGTPVTYYGEELGMENAGDTVYVAGGPMLWDNSTNAGFTDGTPWIPMDNYNDSNVELQQKASISNLHVYEALIRARNFPSIMHGKYESTVYNSSVFAFTRQKSGNPGYLVALNTGENYETVNFKNLKSMSNDLTLLIKSSNFKIVVGIKAEKVNIPAKGALVFTFVPQQE